MKTTVKNTTTHTTPTAVGVGRVVGRPGGQSEVHFIDM